MYIFFNIVLILSLGWSSVSGENSNSSSIYIFNYHNTVDNRTNLTQTETYRLEQTSYSDQLECQWLANKLSTIVHKILNQIWVIPNERLRSKSTTFQPVYTAILNLTELPSISRMETESFKPDFIAELPKEETQLTIKKGAKRDLPTSESATILINWMNSSRMLNSKKVSHFIDDRPTAQASNTTNNQSDIISSNKRINQTNDGDMLKFEDEFDIQPHSFDTMTLLNVSSIKLSTSTMTPNSKEQTTTAKPEEEESLGKKLKKKHLQMMQLKKKLKNNPDKFKAIKIRAPRLHFGNGTKNFDSDKQMRRHKIGYASLVRTRNVNLTDYHLNDRPFMKKRIQKIDNQDQLDSSGSENRIRLIMIHSYKKPAVERFAKRVMINHHQTSSAADRHPLIGAAGQTHPVFVRLHGNRRLGHTGSSGDEETIRGLTKLKGNNNAGQSNSDNKNIFQATYQSSSNRYIPKLLLPRFTRPKMYSLDGFIPRPNSQKFTTTTSSSLNVNHNADFTRFQRNKSGRNSSDKQSDKSSNNEIAKRRKSKSSTNDLDDDDLRTSGSATRKRQILFMKRKGFGFEEEVNSLKPKSTSQEKKKNSNRKGLKAIDFQFPKANYPKEFLNIPEAPKFEYPFNRKNLSKDGKNYPSYAEIPKTSFQCPENLSSGVFSDFETRCQVWHMCEKGTKHSFLCANGTVFNEKVGVCDHWYNVNCSANNVNSVKLTKLY